MDERPPTPLSRASDGGELRFEDARLPSDRVSSFDRNDPLTIAKFRAVELHIEQARIAMVLGNREQLKLACINGLTAAANVGREATPFTEMTLADAAVDVSICDSLEGYFYVEPVTIADALRYTRGELLMIPRFGPKSFNLLVEQIRTYAAVRNIHLKEPSEIAFDLDTVAEHVGFEPRLSPPADIGPAKPARKKKHKRGLK